MLNDILLLDVRDLRISFDDRPVLAGVELSVRRGAVVSVVGKSGTGKSVFIKCIAGLLVPDGGEIRFDGQILHNGQKQVPAEFRRRCSYLFQHNALLDSLTALENVALPLEQTTHLSESEIIDRAREALDRLELDPFRNRFPGQMSGGMQKRVALARALVTQPEIVLFDEPTTGLDPVRRNALFEMIARYQRSIGFTALIVTHDVPEALAVSDQIALLDEGKMRFCGTPSCFRASSDPAIQAFCNSAESLQGLVKSLHLRKRNEETL